MRNIAIYGMGAFGQYIHKKVSEMKDVSVVCFIDNYKEKSINELPVYTLENYNEDLLVDEIWVANSNYYALGHMIMSLHEKGFDKVTIIKPELWDKFSSGQEASEIYEYVYTLDISYKAVITKLEYHVCDHCNLNCAGCSHFSPILTKAFADKETFEKDMIQLSKKYANVLRFRLMGGEPFLHEGIADFVRIARMYLPNSRIEIVTNGLLIPQISNEVWDIIKNADAVINVSFYPPTYIMRERIMNVLDEKGIHFSFGAGLFQKNVEGIIEEFHTGFTTEKSHNGSISATHCMGRDCHYFRNGKISKCALPLLASHINDYFDLSFQVSADDFVDIYDENISPWETVQKLDNATPFCDYCMEDGAVRFKWNNSGDISREDYFVRNQKDKVIDGKY